MRSRVNRSTLTLFEELNKTFRNSKKIIWPAICLCQTKKLCINVPGAVKTLQKKHHQERDKTLFCMHTSFLFVSDAQYLASVFTIWNKQNNSNEWEDKDCRKCITNNYIDDLKCAT